MLVNPVQSKTRIGVWLSCLIPAGLLGGAYIGQYGFGLYPCEMCWWQRYPHFAALVFGALAVAFMTRGRGSARGLALLAAASICVSGLIGGFHAGVEYGWWDGLTACTSVIQPEPGETYLEAALRAPIVRCDVAPWELLGISLAGYNFLISCGSAILIAVLLRRK
jgi:disulfide bond formation protein DsbB